MIRVFFMQVRCMRLELTTQDMCYRSILEKTRILTHTLTSFIIMNIIKAGWLRRRWALRDSHDFLPPLSRTAVRNLLEEYEDALASGSPLAIAIDGVSMLDGVTFGRILRRIEEFESDYFDSTPPRLFFLVGKFAFVSIFFNYVHLIGFYFFFQETFS